MRRAHTGGGPGLPRTVGRVRRRTPRRPHAPGRDDQSKGIGQRRSASSRRKPLAERSGGPARLPLRRRRNRRARPHARRSRETARRFHRRSHSRREGRLRRRGASRRTRLHPRAIPLRRNEQAHRPLRRLPRKPRPHRVRNHRRRARRRAPRFPARHSSLARTLRPQARRNPEPRARTAAPGQDRLSRPVAVGLRQGAGGRRVQGPHLDELLHRTPARASAHRRRRQDHGRAAGERRAGSRLRLRHHRPRRHPAPRFPEARAGRPQLPIAAAARHGATPARRRPEPAFHQLHERLEGVCGRRSGVTRAGHIKPALFALAMAQAACPHPARADNCRPVELASFDIAYNAVLIPVTINGAGYVFMVDTGGYVSTMSPGVADTLHLKPAPVEHGLEIYMADGTVLDQYVTVDNLQLGLSKTSGVRFVVQPLKSRAGLEYFSGTLAPDFLHNFDLDFDFGNRKLNLMSPGQCPGKGAYWSVNAIEVPFRTDKANHIVVPVKLDGVQTTAVVDTGASSTVMSQELARRAFGLATNKGLEALPNATGRSLVQYQHVFQT